MSAKDWPTRWLSATRRLYAPKANSTRMTMTPITIQLVDMATTPDGAKNAGSLDVNDGVRQPAEAGHGVSRIGAGISSRLQTPGGRPRNDGINRPRRPNASAGRGHSLLLRGGASS